MYRLGLRLTLRSGRESFVRLLVTAAAVAVGVAIMLAVLADFHAFGVTTDRPSWESTTGQPVSKDYASASSSELWHYSNDIYRGQTIERLDVVGLGPQAPVPPGISRLPASGQYYASPALAALIRNVPADELGDRFPGRLAGTIGQQALTGPDELVIYIGDAPAKLAGLEATILVGKIATAHERQIWSSYFRDAFVVGAIAFLFPILILVGTASRLAAARREERFAALRLVGATSRQISVISSVDAVVSALLGAIGGIAIFTLLQPALASTAITSARYFSDEVTPTAAGYLAVLIGVPAASAISALLSLRRVRISPLGVSRRVTPPAPSAWRVVPLLAGIALFMVGLRQTSTSAIGKPVFPGLLLILLGLVVGGPWLTMQAARLFSRIMTGAPALLAARRLADNPKAAFRSVSGLVLAVFLGTVVAGLLPAVDSFTATPSAQALSSVLLDGFMSAPVCGNNVNCTGGAGPKHLQEAESPLQQRITLEGLPPQAAATLLRGLRADRGATVIPVYSLPRDSNPAVIGPGGPGNNAVISCQGLRQLAVLGQCAPGRTAVQVSTGSMIYGDNPHFSTQPIASESSPAASGNFSGLYLQAVLVKVNSAATLEKVRTFLVAHATQSASGTAPRTFGEAVQAREGVAVTVQRLVYIAVILTLVVAGCSLAVAVGGSLVERKRPFTLLRLTGTPTSTLYRVVFLEAVLPLVAAMLFAAGTAYGISVLTVNTMAPAGTPLPVLGHVYYLTMAAGLIASLLVIVASLPLLGRITGPGSARFE
ncbi:MAG TPA: FtsX-like permease family protein [Streptosporangiaceae bacterium]|nr:FtsX-like permease family protein [Streptosporangiaceae bacterium]